MSFPATRVQILLFAAHREAVRTGRLEREVEAGTSVQALYELIACEHPGLGPLRPYTAFAVNREVVPPGHELRDGDEVAFLQPVSGGAP